LTKPNHEAETMTPQKLELAPRPDGARYRRVTLTVEHDGVVSLLSHERGADLRAAWQDDEEVTLSVAPDHVARLAAALAAEILSGGRDAIARLAEICEEHDVPCRIACWS
jgi:hypothetical protein